MTSGAPPADTSGHVIIATREHGHYFDEMAPTIGSTLYARIPLIRHALHSVGLADNDVRLFVSDGEPDYATVAHVHAHVFPERRGAAPARYGARGGTPAGSRSHLDATAAKLSQVLRDGTSEPMPVGPPMPGHSAVFISPHRQSSRRA
jgi:diadenosine tetraphosphate (Ap4A) HIT family hydrolase